MQSLISRPLAAVIEKYGFEPVCFAFAWLPIAGYVLVHLLIPDDAGFRSSSPVTTRRKRS